MHRTFNCILITGGSGFIGSNFIEYLLETKGFLGDIVNLDILSYAANIQNNDLVCKKYPDQYHFVNGDICDGKTVQSIIDKYGVDAIVHFAAESHVDRSICSPETFLNTNIYGTYNLLEVYRKNTDKISLFHHVSTDEVYGSLGDMGAFIEVSPYDPSSPYSASKASSDMVVKAYHRTYGLDVTISNCTNNFGPYQHEEKFIPVVIRNLIAGQKIPVYGTGKNIRNWIYVDDHSEAIYRIITNGRSGEQYLIGSDDEYDNLTLSKKIYEIIKRECGLDRPFDECVELVTDRKGHDWRYAVETSKIEKELQWKAEHPFDDSLAKTVNWYLKNVNSNSRNHLVVEAPLEPQLQ